MSIKIIRLSMLFLAALCIAACSSKVTTSQQSSLSKKGVKDTMTVPYVVADHYFVNNNITEMPPVKITTKEIFDKNFGMAAVMGEGGQPIVVDFSREYVIAVTKPETDVSTQLEPVSLMRDAKGNMVFTYKVIRGEKQSYTILPCLLIIVKNSYQGNVVLNER